MIYGPWHLTPVPSCCETYMAGSSAPSAVSIGSAGWVKQRWNTGLPKAPTLPTGHYHTMPCHHALAEALHAYIAVLSAFEPARKPVSNMLSQAAEPPLQAASRIPSAIAVRRI